MQKKVEYAFQQMNKDVAKSKHSPTFYWDAKNIRIVTNSEFGDVTNVKGNKEIFELPAINSNPSDKTLVNENGFNVDFPIINPYIIHTEKIDEKLIVFTTNDEVDCIWLVEEVSHGFTSELLFIDTIGFT